MTRPALHRGLLVAVADGGSSSAAGALHSPTSQQRQLQETPPPRVRPDKRPCSEAQLSINGSLMILSVFVVALTLLLSCKLWLRYDEHPASPVCSSLRSSPVPNQDVCACPPGAESYDRLYEPMQLRPPTGSSLTVDDVTEWVSALKVWRAACRKQLHAEPRGPVGPANLPGLRWTQTSYIQPQVHPYDRFLWDPTARNHTVERYLQDVRERYGGIDSVLLWPTYTNMGVDDRNQFDMIRSMPGGLPAVAQLVKQFHSSGVKVLWPYHPWDISTRRELCGDSGPQSVAALDCTPGAPLDDASAVSAILLATGADGVNGDTMSEFSHQFYVRTKNVTGRPIGLQPERGESIDALAWSTIMWAEGWDNTPPPSWNPIDGDVWPPVSAAKMISESYMVQLTDRWAQNKAPQAATAWFNGIGLNSWENVWGIWNGLTPRDAELYRRMGALLRFAGGHTQGRGQEDATSTRSLLRSADWTPFAPTIHASNGPAFASTFVSSTGTPHEVFISVVSFGSRPGGLFPPPNTSEYADAWFELDPMYGSDHGYRLFDCYLGLELPLPRNNNGTGSANGGGGDTLNVSFTLEASYDSLKGLNGMSGFTGLLLTKNRTVDASLLAFLDRMRQLTSAKPLASFPCYGYMCAGTADLQPWPFFESCNTSMCAGLTQQLVAIPPTANFSIMPPSGGGRMVAVPGGTFSFATTGVEIEGLDQQGVDVRFPWEDSPRKTHTAQTLAMPQLWVDAHPVTNELYEQFLNESSWVPADRERWLLHWRAAAAGGGGKQPTMPQSLAKRPVSYVSLSDARAFCAHYQKRLPHSWEWQWASGQAAGDGRPYPWGHTSPSVHTCPKAQRGGVPKLHDVGTAPAGCSPHGVCDAMCSVWQLTDEFYDQHSRAVLLKGGSSYVMDGSSWYFPPVETLAQHGKYFLYSDGWERSATIGFRCVADRNANDTQPISMESEKGLN